MEPQQPHTPLPYQPQDPNNPYQFIMEPPKKQKLTGGGLSGNPFIIKIIFFVGAAVALIIVAGIAINIFFAPKTNVDDIVGIAQTEQEIIRIATLGHSASATSIQDAAISTQLAVTTQQQSWLTFLATYGKKISAKDINLKKNVATDNQLTQAKATSSFDGTYKTILRTQLEAYQVMLKDAADNAGTAKEKATLLAHYNQVQLLLQQLPEN